MLVIVWHLLADPADVIYSLHQERWWLGEDDEAALQG
jgi:hypothetical protein